MLVYTRPPYPSYMFSPETAYPYLLINAYDETTLRYVVKDSRFIKSVILDSGVYSVFHRRKLKEYPGGHQYWIARVANIWRSLARYVKESYAVIPDYPADYDNNPIDDNVERTFRNIEYAVERHPDVKWIIPIQGKKDDVVSVVRSFEYIRDSGLLERYGYVAIAPTCTTNDLKFLRDVAQIIWRRVKQVEGEGRRIKIHMFGITMKAWKDVSPYIDSTDTIVGNIWCRPLIGKMCTTKEEKAMAWRIFLGRATQVAAITRM
ncbi:MAG: hypothetical protein RQ839_09090 [Thermoproteus sp.]|nr:hypothetical protein [Thermoproteus sp.]MDT7882839.1 hypothetical protein [Thermoproteus sp.]